MISNQQIHKVKLKDCIIMVKIMKLYHTFRTNGLLYASMPSPSFIKYMQYSDVAHISMSPIIS